MLSEGSEQKTNMFGYDFLQDVLEETRLQEPHVEAGTSLTSHHDQVMTADRGGEKYNKKKLAVLGEK